MRKTTKTVNEEQIFHNNNSETKRHKEMQIVWVKFTSTQLLRLLQRFGQYAVEVVKVIHS